VNQVECRFRSRFAEFDDEGKTQMSATVNAAEFVVVPAQTLNIAGSRAFAGKSATVDSLAVPCHRVEYTGVEEDSFVREQPEAVPAANLESAWVRASLEEVGRWEAGSVMFDSDTVAIVVVLDLEEKRRG
jgi:hypothetical protein